MITCNAPIFQLLEETKPQKYGGKNGYKSAQKCSCMVYFYVSIFHKNIIIFKKNCVVPPIEDEMNGLNEGGNGMAEQCTCNAVQCRRKMSFSPALQLLQHFKTKNCDKISLYMRKYLKRK